MRLISPFFALILASAQSLPDTQVLVPPVDPAQAMADGIGRYLLRETRSSEMSRKPSRQRLRHAAGVLDARVPFSGLELVGTTESPALVHDGPSVRVWTVRWPVLAGVAAEGLYFQPKSAVRARVLVLPDAGQAPEDAAIAWQLAASGCEVLVPTLIDRKVTWSGNPKFRMTNQPHREFIYRMAFTVGRHVIGYEVQKALAALDWFARQPKTPIGVWGYGEGGLLALYAAALDERIEATVVSGYFQSRQELWKEPIYRNVWGLLKDFGDAELALLAAPRTVLVETRRGPEVATPTETDSRRRGAAPGALVSPTPDAARAEAERARKLGANVAVHADATESFLKALGVPVVAAGTVPSLPRQDRQQRQFQELVDYTQKLVRQSEARRNEYWSKVMPTRAEAWHAAVQPYRDYFWTEVIGRLPAPSLPMNPRSRKSYAQPKWDGYEVTLDLWPDVFAYGVLLLPKDLKPGERRPVVVTQHGLNGRPQSMFGVDVKSRDFEVYQNIGGTLADLGFIVYLPQNPYTGEFRQLQRLANPLRLSIFSFILAQHDRLLDWLTTLPFVDSKRIGFYGLSYGGKTALRIPSLLDRYALSICSGDFNEWVVKLTTVDARYTYMFTHEYEMNEYDLASVANHAEMAYMVAPRPFMVERGHRDGVGDDEWVAYEYAKVRRLYDEMEIGDRTAIEFFNGPHRINGKGTVEFLRRHLGW